MYILPQQNKKQKKGRQNKYRLLYLSKKIGVCIFIYNILDIICYIIYNM